MEIKTELYKNEGMYLHAENGDFIDLSREHIKQFADEFWNDPAKFPPSVKTAEDIKTCSICPYHGQSVLCSAMKPVLPFLEAMDRFVSYDNVTAVYVRSNGIIHIFETTMQDALQYVTNMAVFEYCEDAKQYRKYFQGVTPFMKVKEAVCHIFLNIYWLNKGDRPVVDKIIKDMHEAVTITSSSCIKRLNVVCKSDAFKNAYIKTQIFAERLSMGVDDILDKYFSGKF